YKQVFEAMASQLQTNAGIQIEINTRPQDLPAGAAYCDGALPIESGIWAVGFDASTMVENDLVAKSCRYVQPVSAAWDKVVAAPDMGQREAALKEFASTYHDQALHIELFNPDFLVGKRKQGITYQVAPYANGNSYQQYFDVTSLTPLAPNPTA